MTTRNELTDIQIYVLETIYEGMVMQALHNHDKPDRQPQPGIDGYVYCNQNLGTLNALIRRELVESHDPNLKRWVRLTSDGLAILDRDPIPPHFVLFYDNKSAVWTGDTRRLAGKAGGVVRAVVLELQDETFANVPLMELAACMIPTTPDPADAKPGSTNYDIVTWVTRGDQDTEETIESGLEAREVSQWLQRAGDDPDVYLEPGEYKVIERYAWDPDGIRVSTVNGYEWLAANPVCPTCKGNGWFGFFKTCPMCGGTGIAQPEPTTPIDDSPETAPIEIKGEVSVQSFPEGGYANASGMAMTSEQIRFLLGYDVEFPTVTELRITIPLSDGLLPDDVSTYKDRLLKAVTDELKNVIAGNDDVQIRLTRSDFERIKEAMSAAHHVLTTYEIGSIADGESYPVAPFGEVGPDEFKRLATSGLWRAWNALERGQR